MKRIASWLLAGCVSALAWAQMPAAGQPLTVDEIVAKNAAARGGVDAWRKVRTMIWMGHVESANAPTPNAPFVLALRRPNSTRFEITAMNQRIVRVCSTRHVSAAPITQKLMMQTSSKFENG